MFNRVFMHLLFEKMYSVLKVAIYVKTCKRVYLIIQLGLLRDITLNTFVLPLSCRIYNKNTLI